MDIEPEVLIELVKKHRNIYDKSHFKFKNKVARYETFNIIAEALGYHGQGETCEMKWRSLRNRFCTELRQLSTGNPTNTPSNWRYFGMMKWLEKYIAPRQNYLKKLSVNFDSLKYSKSDLISDPAHSEDNDVILNETEVELPSISSLDHEYSLSSDCSPNQSKHNHVCADSHKYRPTEGNSITTRTCLSSDSSSKHNHVYGNSVEYKPTERNSITARTGLSSESSPKHKHVYQNSVEYKPTKRYSIANHEVLSSDSSPKHNHVYRNSDEYKPTERTSSATYTGEEEEDYVFGKMVAKYLTRIKNLDKKLQAKMEILNVFKTTRDDA